MQQKIPSDQRPELFTELKQEFSVPVRVFGIRLRWFFRKYQVLLLAAMLVCILFSAVLAFTVMRVGKVEPMPSISKSTGTVKSGFSKILQTGSALQQVLDLQSQINTILQKDSLSANDSTAVKAALKKLELIQHQLNPKSFKK